MVRFARIQDQMMIGKKSMQPDEDKGSLDAKDLLALLRSIDDLYNYIS